LFDVNPKLETIIVMKILKLGGMIGIFALGGFPSLVEAENQEVDTAVIGGISTGQSVHTEPQQPSAKRDFVVKQTFKQRMGNRSVTIQEVEPPVVESEPERAQPQITQTESPINPADIEEHVSPEFIVVTATVYGSGTNTHSQITLSHKNKKCVAISRADFRIMTGFTQFKANSRPYFIISHIVDADAPGQKSSANPLLTNRRIPATGFVVTEIDKGNPQLRQILRDLHDLYETEEQNLRNAYETRKQNTLVSKPPEPDKPVTIRFWKRDMEKEKVERGTK